jgi:hypothetical protein
MDGSSGIPTDKSLHIIVSHTLSTKANDADSPSLFDILSNPADAERDKWIRAMHLELDDSKIHSQVKHIVLEFAKVFALPYEHNSSTCTVFEDDQPAIASATQNPPQLTPRSKHIAVKYHWFRSNCKLDDSIKLQYIPTDKQDEGECHDSCFDRTPVRLAIMSLSVRQLTILLHPTHTRYIV